MNKLENDVIRYMRDAIANLDTDSILVSENMRDAHYLFSRYLMEWSEDFAVLYAGMLKIHHAHTPFPKGHHHISHIEVGYSSFAVSKWVSDKEQPPIPTADELVARFDQLISSYTSIQEAA